ncbi:MAG: branched-chain amino acid ABC transporter permease [Actinobacteria bacterium HGW-Actinobacteria-6]|nr:MAG: branched-chain amino acid ABC transporter permease [Actinobacteria bacterium HGW-Actinobacteria-6]
MSADVLVQQLINGITLGGLYALIALGYTLVYGIMLMINFAHSEMFMSGGYVGLFVLKALTNESLVGVGTVAFFKGSSIGLIILFAMVFLSAAIVVGLLGVVIERFAYRPLRHAPRLAPLISAIGVSIFLQNAVLLWVDSKALPFPSVMPVVTVIDAGGVTVNSLQILILVTTLLLLAVLDTFVSKTRIGKAMRATSQDREAAGLMGIDINQVIALAFFIGPALGGIAGVFHGMYYGSVKFDMGFLPGIKSFTAAVIGGIGNLRGAMLGGFVLGILESLAAGFLSAGYKDVVAFAILILVLIFRPGGLLGESVVEKV